MFTVLLDYMRTLLILAGYVSGTASFPKPLTKAEEREYLEKFKNGDDDAKNILIERNLPAPKTTWPWPTKLLTRINKSRTENLRYTDSRTPGKFWNSLYLLET